MDIGLTLGGGGARGGVHMGVLEVLEPFGIRPYIITGTSIGGLIGAMVAKGLTLNEINDIVKHFHFAEMYSVSFRSDVFSDNNRYRTFLENVFGEDSTFQDLEIPLAVVATDLRHKQAVVLSDGEIVPALLATSALPLVFPVVKHQGYELLDGGLLNSTPFDVARARGADIVIAIDLTDTERSDNESMFMYSKGILNLLDNTETSPVKILGSILDILNTQSLKAHMLTAPPDVLIRPHLGTISLMDFNHWDIGVEIGRQAATDALPHIEQVITAFEQRERMNIFNKGEILQTLNALLSFNRNVGTLFRNAQTQYTDSPLHKQRFAWFIETHTTAATALEEHITGLSGKPAVSRDIAIEAQLQLMSLGRFIRQDQDIAFLRFCLKTIAGGINLYAEALNTRMPDDLRTMLMSHKANLEAELDLLREEIS